MRGDAFFDTNVLIYAVALDDPRNEAAEVLLARGGVLSVQVLNEFVAVAVRKLGMPWKDLREALDAFRALCPLCVPVTIDTHATALGLAERSRLNIYDALIVAAALEAGCSTLYSENLRDGWVVEGRLTVRNPFSPKRS